jgi:peptidase A4-like protein
MKRSIKSSVVHAMAAAWALSLASAASAQSDAVNAIYLSAAHVPTNVTEIKTYATPPAGFNPLSASAEELATYGFPQRPDQQADPGHYAQWERAMAAARIRWNGEPKLLHADAHPTVSAGLRADEIAANALPLAGPVHGSTVNWSGVVLQNGRKTWSNTYSFNDIYATITVATAELPFGSGSCDSSGATDLTTVSFAGIDAYNVLGVTNGQLQGGVFTDINCSSGSTSYYAYAGWGFAIGEFTVNPGDLFYTEVHGFGGFNAGTVYIEDLTTLTYNSYSVANTSGLAQIGRDAEWIVERFCCGSGGGAPAYPLANTLGIFFDGAAAIGSGKNFFPGSQASNTVVLMMTNDQGNQTIEGVYSGITGWEGQRVLQFYTTGCAYTPGCTP